MSDKNPKKELSGWTFLIVGLIMFFGGTTVSGEVMKTTEVGTTFMLVTSLVSVIGFVLIVLSIARFARHAKRK